MIEIETEDDFNRELSENSRLLVLFYAGWCPYCIKFVPVFDRKATSYKATKVIHVRLDDNDNPLWDVCDVEAVPTVILFEKGKVSSRLDGQFGLGLSERQLNTWLQKLTLE
jgi:thioredoxin 1